MKLNLKVLHELAPTYGVAPVIELNGATQVINSKKKGHAPPALETLLNESGYSWKEKFKAYVLDDQYMYYLPNGIFMWVWDMSMARLFDAADKLEKWVKGDFKYPEGKAKSFMGTYLEMTGQGSEGGGVGLASPDEKFNEPEMDRAAGQEPTSITFNGIGKRAGAEPEPMDKADAIIAKAKKKMGKDGTLPADDIIDLYQKAKEMKNNKLMTFVKTIKPLNERFIKKSTLNEVIRLIVKTILNESSLKDQEEDPVVIDIANNVWGNDESYVIRQDKKSEFGRVYKLTKDVWPHGNGIHPKTTKSLFIWKTTDGQWKTLDPKTRKWSPVTQNNPSEQLTPLGGMEEHQVDRDDINYGDELYQDVNNTSTCCGAPKRGDSDICGKCGDHAEFSTEVDEESGACAAGPVTGPMAFKKKRTMEHDEQGIHFPLPSRMHIKTLTSVPDKQRLKFAVQILMHPEQHDEQTQEEAREMLRAKGYSDEKIASLSNPQGAEVALEEMTTTSGGGGSDAGTPGYNVPGCFSRRGGSAAGVAGSAALGYELTPIGKQDMKRHADKLLENKQIKDGQPICHFCNKPLRGAQISCHHCGKTQPEIKSGEKSHAKRFSTRQNTSK